MLQILAATRLVRRLADAMLHHYAARRVDALNRRPIGPVQQQTLLRLVHHARNTRFGREHGFRHIHSIRDYQKQVPLRNYESYWKTFWESCFPRIDDITWPGHIPYFALSSGTTSGATKYIPVTKQLMRSSRKAGFTTTALYLAAHPESSLLTGRLFFLGGSTNLRQLGEGEALAGDFSGIVANEVPVPLRAYTFPPVDPGLSTDWDDLVERWATASARLPITLISGIPSWLLVFFERLKAVTGRQSVAEIWPSLRVVVHGGTRFDPYRKLFRQVIGNDRVDFQETYACSECGFIAAEDPWHGLLRLLPDHGIFFEFVPVDELDAERPVRHTVIDLEPGVHYAVILTTCTGLWSYLLGDTVCFEQRNPPLLRFTGRTRYFLSAFGEHLISEEVEQAVASAADAVGSSVVEFHVGPLYPLRPGEPGRHRYLIEFTRRPDEFESFATAIDAHLRRVNCDYDAHRSSKLNLGPPVITSVRQGGFADWMRARGKLGGQHKLPRMDNTGQLTEEILHWMEEAGAVHRQ
jgi:GH3 auxin-responsive promoter